LALSDLQGMVWPFVVVSALLWVVCLVGAVAGKLRGRAQSAAFPNSPAPAGAAHPIAYPESSEDNSLVLAGLALAALALISPTTATGYEREACSLLTFSFCVLVIAWLLVHTRGDYGFLAPMLAVSAGLSGLTGAVTLLGSSRVPAEWTFAEMFFGLITLGTILLFIGWRAFDVWRRAFQPTQPTP
jgi:hypothetical protein